MGSRRSSPVVSPLQVWPALAEDRQRHAIALLVRLAREIVAALPVPSVPSLPEAPDALPAQPQQTPR